MNWNNTRTFVPPCDKKIKDNENDNISIRKGEDNKMSLSYSTTEKKEDNSLFEFDFGSLENYNEVRLSPYGLAVRNVDNTWVAYDKNSGCIVNTNFFNFPQANKYMYKVPAPLASVRVGDIVLHHRKPMFVMDIELDKKTLYVTDIYAGEEKTILPTQSPFGFNFITKIVSMFDFGNPNMTMGASESNPFGNILPLLLFSDKDKEFDPMMMMFMMGGSNPFAQMFCGNTCSADSKTE